MAIPKLKATYALDPETIRALERMARRWGVSKSEALRRAIRAAEGAAGAGDALAALDEAQRVQGLAPPEAARWQRAACEERRASSRRRERRGA